MTNSITALYTPLLLSSAAVAVVISITAWRRRPAPGALGLALLELSAWIWSFAYALQWALTRHEPSLFWFVVRHVGVIGAAGSALVLVLEYTGRDRVLRRLGPYLAAAGVALLVLMATDGLHHLYLGAAPAGLRVWSGGPLLPLLMLYSWATMLSAMGLLAESIVRKRGIYRLQSAVLLVALALPFGTTIMQQLGYQPLPFINPTPLVFNVTGPLLAFGLFRLGLLTIIPVARDQLIESLPDGVVVVDAEHRVVDMNPAARRMGGVSISDIGKTVDEVFAPWGDAISSLRTSLESGISATEIRPAADPDRLVEVSASALHEPDGRRVATIVTMRDVTERAAMTLQLQARGEELAVALEQSSLVLGAMSDGVVLIDDNRSVLQANHAASRILRTDLSSSEVNLARDLTSRLPIESLAMRAAETGTPVTETIDVTDGRALTVEAIPLRKTKSRRAQTLLVIRDETERLAAERMQRDFVANVSHELQTPLTGLLLLADTLPRAVRDDPGEVEGFVARLGTEVRRMVKMTGELVTLSRMEDISLAHRTPMARTDLSRVVADIVEASAPLASEKQQHLSVDLASDVFVVGDETSLEALACSLIENAIRYTPTHGDVTVGTRIETDARGLGWALLTVADNGVGISPKDQERVFERFFRVDKARSRSTGGTGLGLSIARHAAEAHDGTIHLQSTLGEGSVFTVRIPLAH